MIQEQAPKDRKTYEKPQRNKRFNMDSSKKANFERDQSILDTTQALHETLGLLLVKAANYDVEIQSEMKQILWVLIKSITTADHWM